MIKILEVETGKYTVGGIETYISGLVDGIASSDFEIDFFSLFHIYKNNKPYELLKKNCKNLYSGEVLNNSILNVFKLVLNCAKIFKINRYDVVHIHADRLINMAIVALVSKIFHIRKIIVHSHNSGNTTSLKHKMSWIISEPLILISATDYCACSIAAGESKFTKKIVDKKLVILKNGIDLNRYGIDCNVREEFRKKLNISDSEKVIGHVGRFSDVKNHKFIIDLISALIGENRNYKLILIGDGELKLDIEKYAKEKGVYEDVIFTGNVINVQDYMQAMDLFVLPSKFEGLGIVAIEAQACGLPVILSHGVPNEAKITNNTRFISTDNITKWVDSVEKMVFLPKENNTKAIKSAGYDINETTNIIKKMYFE